MSLNVISLWEHLYVLLIVTGIRARGSLAVIDFCNELLLFDDLVIQLLLIF